MENPQANATLPNGTETRLPLLQFRRVWQIWFALAPIASLFEVAEVFRDLHRLKRTKTLAFGERRMLETARGLIVQELSVAKGLSAAKIEGELSTLLS